MRIHEVPHSLDEAVQLRLFAHVSGCGHVEAEFASSEIPQRLRAELYDLIARIAEKQRGRRDFP